MRYFVCSLLLQRSDLVLNRKIGQLQFYNTTQCVCLGWLAIELPVGSANMLIADRLRRLATFQFQQMLTLSSICN